MTRYVAVMAVVIVVGCVAALASGQWPVAVVLLGSSILVVGEGRELRRVDAKRDLREVYPPARDQFHRDLERLNKLRGAPADAKRSEPGRAAPELVIRAGDDPASVLRAHRRQLDDEWCEIESGRRRRHSVFVAVLEGARDGLRIMAPFLTIALFGAVIGLVVSLL